MKLTKIIDTLQVIKQNGTNDVSLSELEQMLQEELLADTYENLKRLTDSVLTFLMDGYLPKHWSLKVLQNQVRVKFTVPMKQKGGPTNVSMKDRIQVSDITFRTPDIDEKDFFLFWDGSTLVLELNQKIEDLVD